MMNIPDRNVSCYGMWMNQVACSHDVPKVIRKNDYSEELES